MSKCFLSLVACLAISSVSFAGELTCEQPNSSAVVTQNTYGAVNYNDFSSMQSSIETHDNAAIKDLSDKGLIVPIRGATIACIESRSTAQYRVRIRVPSSPVPVWVDDHIVRAVE